MKPRTVTQAELDTPLLPYEEALARALAAVALLSPVELPLGDALGLVLAESVTADHDVPAFDGSAMDGYAVRSADTTGATRDEPITLRLVDDLPAGRMPSCPLPSRAACKIMTGAPIPAGADAVIPWEETQSRPGGVDVLLPAVPGRHVRRAGEDMRPGQQVLTAGAILGAAHVGIAAALGLARLVVRPRPRVAVLSTGQEVVQPGETLAPGQVHDANATLIAAMVREVGGVICRVGLVGDDPAALTAWLLEAAAQADLVVTSAGVSVGEHDWLRHVLESEGSLTVWRVAIKPGKPVALGHIRGTPVLALPGNPGSAFVAAHTFVLPVVRHMSGRTPGARWVRARLTEAVGGSPNRTFYARVRLEGELAAPLDSHSSVVLSNLVATDGFAVIPPGGLSAGADVRVEMIG